MIIATQFTELCDQIKTYLTQSSIDNGVSVCHVAFVCVVPGLLEQTSLHKVLHVLPGGPGQPTYLFLCLAVYGNVSNLKHDAVGTDAGRTSSLKA